MNRTVSRIKAFSIIGVAGVMCAAVVIVSSGRVGYTDPLSRPYIEDFTVRDGEFVARTHSIEHCEIWATETSGDAQQWIEMKETDVGRWRAQVPATPRRLHRVEVRGYSSHGELVDREALAFTSPHEITTALWGPGDDMDVVLSVGESASFGDATVTLKSILEDSRCPADIQCITPGVFDAHVFVRTPEVRDTYVLSLSEPFQTFGSYRLGVVDVEPERSVDEPDISRSEYAVTFRFLVTSDSLK